MKTVGFWTVDSDGRIYKNGKEVSQSYHFKRLTPEQFKLFDEAKNEYLKSLEKVD